MNTVLSIGSDHQENDALLIEAGQGHFSYGWINADRNSFRHLRYVRFDPFEEAASWKAVLDELSERRFGSVSLCLSSPYAVLSPQSFRGEGGELLRALYDLPGQVVLSDALPEWQMRTWYAQSAFLHRMVLGAFPDAQYLHSFTTSLKTYNGATASEQIELNFSPLDFQVLVRKDGGVQLAQIYSYRTPLDVVYFLLKICYDCGIDQQNVAVVLSGMIERDSALYGELSAYFLHLRFSEAGDVALPADDHPAYYFSSLIKLARCAS